MTTRTINTDQEITQPGLAHQTYDGPDLISDGIPEELQFKILTMLGTHDLCALGQVNQKWRALSQDESLWTSLLHHYQFDDITYETTPLQPDGSKKEFVGRVVTALRGRLDEWNRFFQSSSTLQGEFELDMISRKKPLERVMCMRQRSFAFLQAILKGGDPSFEHLYTYLKLRLPIPTNPTYLASIFMSAAVCARKNGHEILSESNSYVMITTPFVLLNMRHGNYLGVQEAFNTFAAMIRINILKMSCAEELRADLLARTTGNYYFFPLWSRIVSCSQGTSFSELFNDPHFDPDFSFVDPVDIYRDFLKIEPNIPFLTSFCLNLLDFTIDPELLKSSGSLVSLIKRHESWDLGFSIAPQEISKEQLLKDFITLVNHPKIDLNRTLIQIDQSSPEGNPITTLQLCYFLRSNPTLVHDNNLWVLDQIIEILVKAGAT